MAKTDFNETGKHFYNAYDYLSEKQKKIALQIEKLLTGLSIEEVNTLFVRINRKVKEETKVTLS